MKFITSLLKGTGDIAEMFASPYRLGLTATFEREDMLHNEIPRLVGGVVFRLEPRSAGRDLSNFRIERVNVDSRKVRCKSNQKYHSIFTEYLTKNRMTLNTPIQFQRFVMRTGRDPEARRALLARNRALKVAFNSESKIDKLEEILRENRNERVIIFTQHNYLVYRISRRFLIPS